LLDSTQNSGNSGFQADFGNFGGSWWTTATSATESTAYNVSLPPAGSQSQQLQQQQMQQQQQPAFKANNFGEMLTPSTHQQKTLETQQGFANAPSQEVVFRVIVHRGCLLYTSPSPRDVEESRMPSSA